jgi:hypothetical protein
MQFWVTMLSVKLMVTRVVNLICFFTYWLFYLCANVGWNQVRQQLSSYMDGDL